MAMEKQMELFEEGGLMQEGGQVDEESGNEVPIGSTKEEVRDDIPAQLSEGEFVMPADVVRYHGLDKMMALRDEAKMGLQRMEAMGQMGNADEAILPDDIPFDINDLEIEEERAAVQESDPHALEDLQQLVEHLPNGYRTVFNLYAIEGFSHREIAEELGITENASRSQLTKARQQLREWIDQRDKRRNHGR